LDVDERRDVELPKSQGAQSRDPVEAIRFRMEQSGYTQADLARAIGSPSRASEILQRRRRLTIEMAWKLHREWNIPAESLLRPYEIDAA
jgi:HTH-type transcriptional regulator/antitoxin HigA